MRNDFDDFKKDSENDRSIIKNDLAKKFTKDESLKLEQRTTAYIESVIEGLKNVYMEKGPLQKRLNKLDRNIRLIKNEITAMKDKDDEEDTGMFTKRILAK